MSNIQKVFIFTILSFLFSLVGSFTRLPGGWRMFSKIERVDLSMISLSGEKISLRNYVPGDFYLISEKHFLKMAKRICMVHFIEEGIDILKGNEVVMSLKKGSCELSKK